MHLKKIPKTFWVIFVLASFVFFAACMLTSKKVDYNTEVKPIFNKSCITCHGGVKRQGGFSLLFRTDALAKNKSGKPAIIPGNPDSSELIKRLTLKDPEERMPYKHPSLSQKEITTLKNWIKDGAIWGDHWAYVPVAEVSIPSNGRGPFSLFGTPSWINNDIDQFIFQKIKKEGLTPSDEADKATLLRRASLDIIGMPASEKLNEWFMHNNEKNAYEKLVDTLLTSPHYGEKWAGMWMDLARYSDTKGYERDDSRNIWRYRDWLIKAFNDNKPYDQFLVEQIAGDLLPNPTDAQYIATAFHRNTMTNDEGGTDNEEFRTAAILDRVNATWEGLMGTSFACVQCHSHPYDPFRHDEYYQFMAFFNNTRDEDTYDDYPLIREFHETDSSKFVALKNWVQQNEPAREKEIVQFIKMQQPAINSIAADELKNAALMDTKWLVFRNKAVARLKDIELTNKTELLYRYEAYRPGGEWQIHLNNPDGPILCKSPVIETHGRWKEARMHFAPTTGRYNLYLTYSNSKLKQPEETGMQFDWFYFTNPFPGKPYKGTDTSYKFFDELLEPSFVTTTPIMMDNPKELFRATHVFERGNWLVKGKEVTPNVPASLGGLPSNAPKNRLGMAMWLTDKKNPLVSRTIVNRIWEQFFGIGIAETLEDMGTQGIPPTHRELLDYMSWKLMYVYHWDLKKLIKEITLSAVYRQDSKLNKEAKEKDPTNKWFARGPRVRLTAEEIRDQALMVSGLMSEKMYGPGVMPFQPEGIWNSPWNGSYWKTSEDGNQYRRSLYTYWKRSAPYPSMLSFDATSREVCTARRIRTNTPLQALTTLNDSVFIEIAKHFADRIQTMGIKEKNAQISKGYELAMHHAITDDKRKAFEKLYDKAYAQFKNNKKKLIETTGSEKQTAENAALIIVAEAMLNTDEFITKN
jgi:Protein of unknown function (DUF1553)/Protein of unknown function (DUF1549)/Planctomycete cytochrome C